ncbi:hypothetical protein J1TS3_29180 [Siminovitchia fordii]|uniref:Uncharacterized protein n=1 Tax=Siminovitchia fordii TaxID=254759 RepID=A0ABQ4K7R6_9BACI|nr:hypothetical protein J1TS3_29180 [Siminovitchia fordii]
MFIQIEKKENNYCKPFMIRSKIAHTNINNKGSENLADRAAIKYIKEHVVGRKA